MKGQPFKRHSGTALLVLGVVALVMAVGLVARRRDLDGGWRLFELDLPAPFHFI